MLKIGIVGLEHVGSVMKQLFNDAFVYDEPQKIGSRDDINACDICFVCVPTPMASDGSCYTIIVEYVINWVRAKIIVLRSTVPVGFTDEMINKTNKRIFFNQSTMEKP